MPNKEAKPPQHTEKEAQPSNGSSARPAKRGMVGMLVVLVGVIAIVLRVINDFGAFLAALQDISAIFSFVKWWHALIVSAISVIIYCGLRKKYGFSQGGSQERQWIYRALLGLMFLPWIPIAASYILPEKASAARVHIAVVIDASARMNEPFHGSASKWEAAQGAAQEYLEFQSEGANYSVFVVGANEQNLTNTCGGLNAPLVPWGLGNRDLAIEQISHIVPNGRSSLMDTLEQARDALVDVPSGETRVVYIVLGGPDECDQADHFGLDIDPWKNLMVSIVDIFGPYGAEIRADLIALVSEDVKNNLEVTYGNLLRSSGIALAADQSELDAVVAQVKEETANSYQDSPGTSTPGPVISRTPRNSPSPICLTATVPPFWTSTPTLADFGPTSATQPTPGMTATCTLVPTATRTLTPLPPTFTSTYTPTDTPTHTPTSTLTCTPTLYDENLAILAPAEGQDFNCLEDELCVISDDVYIGQIGDLPDTPFRIYALVTYELYSRDDVLSYLPASLMQDDVNVTR
jgi:hypothetical protein